MYSQQRLYLFNFTFFLNSIEQILFKCLKRIKFGDTGKAMGKTPFNFALKCFSKQCPQDCIV